MLKGRFVIISAREGDLRMGEFLAFANDLPSRQVTDASEVREAVLEAPGSFVLWDADDPAQGELVGAALANALPARQVAIVTDKPLNEYPHLATFPVFGHHFYRRFAEPAPTLYARIVAGALAASPFGLPRYFPEGIKMSRINITRSGQKGAAVNAIEAIFVKQQVNTRLASLVAQAVDELLMNAIFDAPVLPNGMPLRRGTARDADFELIEQEHVRVEVATTDDYVGICVADQFGSLKRSVLMSFLGKNYHEQTYTLRQSDPGAGLGLNGMLQAGLSLLFISQPGKRTEVMIFFRKDATYKDFRGGFRFLSVITP